MKYNYFEKLKTDKLNTFRYTITIMKKCKFILLNILITFYIFTQDTNTNELISNINQIYLIIDFNDNIKINNKILIKDLTNDLIKYSRKFDTTDDLLKSGKFLYKNDEIEIFNNYKNVLTENIKEYLASKLENISINVINSADSSNLTNGFFIDIKIIDYTEGEYNLIRNRTSIVKLLVKIYEKSSKESVFLLKVDTYFCKSDIEYPTEKMRLKNISEKLSSRILFLIKNYFKNMKK
jgi:hypothetical protein